MSGVHGSSEAVEQLRFSLIKLAQALRDQTEQQANNLKTLSVDCRDDSYTVMERYTIVTMKQIKELLPSISAVCKLLEKYRDFLEGMDESGSAGEGGPVKVLRIPIEQRRSMGLRYIDKMMDIYRENIINKGIPDDESLAAFLVVLKEHYISELEKDLSGKAHRLYEDPNYDTISKLGMPFVLGMHNVLSQCEHQDVKAIYTDFANRVTVSDPYYREGACYVANDGVYFYRDAAASGDGFMDKPYQTAFHEFAHNIDYLMGDGSPISESWGSNALYRAIVSDFEALRGNRSNEQLIKDLRSEAKTNHWTLFQIGSVSDILECLTGINYPLGGGHGLVKKEIENPDGSIQIIKVSYWEGRLPNKEFFAETLDGAAANSESYQMLKRFFPNAVEVVHKIIGGSL